jgi:HemY protein
VLPAPSPPAPGMIDAAPPAAAHSDGDGSERATAAFEASPEPASPPVPPVIPLVHAPDDPGPEGAANPEEPEADPPSEPPPGGWNRFRSFFGS